MAKIVVVDDEKLLRETLKELLELEGYEVYIAEDGRRGLEVINQHKPDLVVTDMRMPVLDGLGLINILKQSDTCKTVIVLTGHGTPENARAAFTKGAVAYLHKPLDFDQLCDNIKRAV